MFLKQVGSFTGINLRFIPFNIELFISPIISSPGALCDTLAVVEHVEGAGASGGVTHNVGHHGTVHLIRVISSN